MVYAHLAPSHPKTVLQITSMFTTTFRTIWKHIRYRRYYGVYRRFQHYTMLPADFYVSNLLLTEPFRKLPGAIVECGVWRGGMMAGMATLLGPDRDYYLFDSFEGLPPVKEADGPGALKWQSDTESPGYYDNCRADPAEAEKAMTLSGASRVHLVKGWFADTLPGMRWDQKIAILRLDGDWYDSIYTCLEHLYPHVTEGGLVLLDDYYFWMGCSRAVHDYLSRNHLEDRIYQFRDMRIAYLVKQKIKQ